ncbi:hypothetical protein [Manganibacter manganicus]|nr:hypothetical protein [Pseudaminobacter manganicus]
MTHEPNPAVTFQRIYEGPFGVVIDENRHAVSDRAGRLYPEG